MVAVIELSGDGGRVEWWWWYCQMVAVIEELNGDVDRAEW